MNIDCGSEDEFWDRLNREHCIEDLLWLNSPEAPMDLLRSIVDTCREILSVLKLQPKKEEITLHIHFRRAVYQLLVNDESRILDSFLKIDNIFFHPNQFEGTVNFRRLPQFDLFLMCSKFEDETKQIDRAALSIEQNKLQNQLSNENFLQKAKPEVVEKARKRAEELQILLKN